MRRLEISTAHNAETKHQLFNPPCSKKACVEQEREEVEGGEEVERPSVVAASDPILLYPQPTSVHALKTMVTSHTAQYAIRAATVAAE
jgi:hypothetical protein